MEDALPSGLLEVCLLVGVPREQLRTQLQDAQRKPRSLLPLDPEVLSVFVPPLISRDDIHSTNTSGSNFNRGKRRSFRKKKERPKLENAKTVNGEQKAPGTEDITVPKDIDLIGLPQLCFPGGLFITSEPREDHIHFLVFTDVCGNRTYGVVAQYYQPMQFLCRMAVLPPMDRPSGNLCGLGRSLAVLYRLLFVLYPDIHILMPSRIVSHAYWCNCDLSRI